jgi:Flp pilus assembly pilin Flp
LRRSLSRDEQGVTAIEFAILGPIFFALLMVLIDLSLFFATHTIVDGAVQNAARAVRLGLLQTDTDGSQFRAVLCKQLFFASCANFTFSVQAVTDLSTVNPKPSIDSDGHLINPQYKPGGPDDLVVITIVYVHHFIVPYVGALFGDDGLNNPQERALTSFLVVKNEPYPG